MRPFCAAALLCTLHGAAGAQPVSARDVTDALRPHSYRLVLTCFCGAPAVVTHPTRAACDVQGHHEMAARNINVPSYRCEEKR